MKACVKKRVEKPSLPAFGKPSDVKKGLFAKWGK